MAPRRRVALRALPVLHPPPAPGAGPGTDGRPVRILVVAHVYYPELWDELAARVAMLPADADLAVSLVRGHADQLAGPVASRFPHATVRVVENRGRDIWPLLQVLDLVDGHDLVLKLHTKRSPHLESGEEWRSQLLTGVCASGAQVREILGLFAQNPWIGVLAPPGNVLGREFLGNNGSQLRALMGRGRRSCDLSDLWFPAGSIFWARASVLVPLAELGLAASDFADEGGAIDGTLPHALERYVGVVAASQGLAVLDVAEARHLGAQRPAVHGSGR